jgi:uncharacterized protein
MPIAPEDLVRTYYALVDAGRTADLLDLFTDDIVYERQGTPVIKGRAGLSRFYTAERTIAAGTHTLDEVLVGAEWVAVRGRFAGTLNTGEYVDVPFTDWHHIAGEKIDHRQSLFPERTV